MTVTTKTTATPPCLDTHTHTVVLVHGTAADHCIAQRHTGWPHYIMVMDPGPDYRVSTRHAHAGSRLGHIDILASSTHPECEPHRLYTSRTTRELDHHAMDTKPTTLGAPVARGDSAA